MLPKYTAVALVKLDPVMLIDPPPLFGPTEDDNPITVGRGMYVNESAPVFPPMV
jgi:hypothetical protein